MIKSIPTVGDIVRAAEILDGIAVKTPLANSAILDKRTGRRIFLKLESHQHTGSFKFRGAYNRLAQLSDREKRQGVVAYSSGNHAQAVAYAARLLGVPATIVMPRDAPQAKLDGTRNCGAEVILYERSTEIREEIAADLARDQGRVLVPPYEDAAVIAGQGTAALEIIDDIRDLGEDLDAAFICCGGGGLTAGCALAFEARSPTVAVFTVEPEGFDDTARSLKAKQRVRNDSDARSICDALLAPMPGELTFSLNVARVTAGISVSDAEVQHAVAFAFRFLNVTLEPGGAVALAAALAGKIPAQHRSVALMCSGANIDANVLQECLAKFPDP